MLPRRGTACFLLLLGVLAPACGGGPLAPRQRSGHPPTDFSSERAWRHLEGLAEVGPRAPGSRESAMARGYILDELSKLDLTVETHAATVPLPPEGKTGIPIENLIAVIPGQSDDLIILATPYDTRWVDDPAYQGVNEGSSGAALLLELARVLSEKPLPYTTWIVFLEGEAPVATEDSVRPSVGLLGSNAFAAALSEHGLIRRVRLAVVFVRVAGADLRIARDLKSHRMYREEFFGAAKRTGHTEIFPTRQPFESPYAAHQSFMKHGARRAVVVSGTSLASEDESGEPLQNSEDTLDDCSPESLGAVGAVTLAALDRITTRLAKIDRFSEFPFEKTEGALAVPVGPKSPEAEEDEAASEVAESTASTPEPEEPAASASAPDEPAAETSADSPNEDGSAARSDEAATAEDGKERKTSKPRRRWSSGLGAGDL